MSKLAVIKLSGSQYIVEEGKTIKAQLPKGSAGELSTNEVLLVADRNSVIVGRPYVKGASVSMKVLDQKRGKKLRVLKYHSKTRYRKTIGFRPIMTLLKIEKIEVNRG